MLKYLLGLLLISLCGCTQRDGKPFETVGNVGDVQFFGAHEDRRCSKGCRYITVPDRWYVQACSAGEGCDFIQLDHPPWAWEQPGSLIKIKWQRYTNGSIRARSISKLESAPP